MFKFKNKKYIKSKDKIILKTFGRIKMKLFGRDISKKMAITFTLHFLIIIDIILITVAIIFTLPENVALDIQMFDFCVCILLLAEWTINFHMSSPKTAYLKNKGNIITLIASITSQVIFTAGPLRKDTNTPLSIPIPTSSVSESHSPTPQAIRKLSSCVWMSARRVARVSSTAKSRSRYLRWSKSFLIPQI